MLPRKQPGRALIVGADLALREFVKDEPPRLVERFGGDNLAAQISEICEPLAHVQGKLSVQFLPKLLGEGRGVSGGRDRDLEVSTPDDGWEVEVAEGRVIDSVAKHAASGRLGKDGPVDHWIVGRGNHEEGSVQIAGLIGSALKRDLSRFGHSRNSFVYSGSDHSDGGVRRSKGFDLGLSQLTGADDYAWSGSELEKEGEEGHFSAPS
jgi:hypothetical protein